MQIIFRCPRCEQTNRTEIEPKGAPIACQNCHAPVKIPDDAALDDGLQHCLICQSDDLFIRKDFPQRLGVMIVVIGFLASSVAWYYYEVILAFAILFATAGPFFIVLITSVPEVRAATREYLPWLIVTPLIAFAGGLSLAGHRFSTLSY